MRSKLKVIVAALCTLALAITPGFAAWGADASSGEMIASHQVTESVAGGKQIKSFKLGIDTSTPGGLYSYESLGNDTDKPTLTLSASALQRIVKEKLLPQWSPVAASVFRDQAGQLVDLYGYENNSGNMSRAGFDAYFNAGRNNVTNEYADEKWSCSNLSSKLAQTTASRVGDPGWDQFTVSGVKQVNSLSGARNMVGQALYDCENHKGLKASEFLDVSEGSDGEARLDELDSEDQTIGFANLVTSVNCKGASSDFDYVTFGIVFYDFEPVPVAANGLEYVSGQFSKVGPVGGPEQTSEIKNAQQQEILHSALLGDSVTETTSTTLSGLASFKMSENIGANISWSETESESETAFWSDDTFGDGSSTSTSSETTTMGLNWGAAWEMAGALGAEVGHSKSVEISKAVETTITLPPHTTTSINHKATSTTLAQTYQQPAILNYKVAIFATSGDFYSGGDGGINPSSYDKQSLVIKFDTKDEETPFYGCVATDDLYSRIITNKDVPNFDVSGDRTYSTHSTASGWKKSEGVNWHSVVAVAQDYYNAKVEENVAKKNFFFESPGKLDVVQDKATSEAQAIYPLYNLASVKTPKTNYVLYSNNTLDYDALAVQGYNKYNVPFYGFTQELGYWCRCDAQGNILNNGQLLDNDPAKLGGDALVPKEGTIGGTMYFIWKADSTDPTKRPITGESSEGQDLTNITSPVVTVQVVNVGLDNPSVTAEGSYTGFYGAKVNLNDYITYEVTDGDDKEIETEANWESREPASKGINVSASGHVTFTKPGTYRVRPYVTNNDNKKVYPNWITITATEHDFVHYDAKAPTNCTRGNADGWIEHYRCSDCGKYFSAPEDSAEIPASDVILDATGHDWGEWTASATLGKQQRVCKNDERHVEKRDVFAVIFNTNGKDATVPETQIIASDAKASVTVPPEPKAAGFTFEGWFTEPECTTPYDFGAAVTRSMTLYAKWSPAKYTVATMAVGDVYVGEDGEEKVDPVAHGSLSIQGAAGEVTTVVEDGYTYSYKEVGYDDTITLTVTPDTNYGLKKIQAVPVNADSSMGEPFTPERASDTTYSFKMPAADVAVMASFGQENVTITYVGNKPGGVTAEVAGVPAAETIEYGKTATKLDTTPTLEGYVFGGWFTDAECAKPCLKTTAITQDTTLYAKWINSEYIHTVIYTLQWDRDTSDPEDKGFEEVSYTIEGNDSVAYDPTNDLYAVAGKDLTAAYELQKDASGTTCWFTDEACTEAYDFKTRVMGDLQLYAKVVSKTYTVTYLDSQNVLGTQGVAYNTAIGTLGIKAPTKEGYTLSGWTNGGKEWNIGSNLVTSDLKLYADWILNKYDVTFDANGQGTAPEKQVVKHGDKATDPGALEAKDYSFGGWYTDKACTRAYDFGKAVTANTTLYAKWTGVQRTVTFDSNGVGSAPAAQKVNHGSTASDPGSLSMSGQVFGGWFTDQGCTKAYNFATPVTADIKLYAKWTKFITPGAVAITSAGSPLKCKVTLTWGAANNADGYEIAVGSIITNVKASKRSAQIVNKKLKAGKKYNVMVRAWHMNGTVKTYGKWSAAKKVKVSKSYIAKTKKKVQVFKKVKKRYVKKAKLKKGAKVKVLRVKGKWAKTNKGWVLKKNLKAVKIANTPLALAPAAVDPAADLTADPAAESTAQSTSSDSASSLTAAQIG